MITYTYMFVEFVCKGLINFTKIIMAISEFEIKRIEKVVGTAVEKRRPPVHIRNEFDIGFRIDNQSVFIFERRQDWRDKSQINE